MCQYAIETKKLFFKYKDSDPYIIKNINLRIKKGEILGIVGLSGSGKSTLINLLNGIIPKRISGILTGDVYINGENIAEKNINELATCIGTIFQNPDYQILFSNAEDEMAFGPENLCCEKFEILNRITDVTKLLNIEKLRTKNPNNLSGGEKQLITIASVLTLNVGIIIFDESMAQIDENGRKLIKDAILKLKNQGKALLMVEHDLDNLDIADRILLLKEGRLQDFEGEM